MHLRIRGAASWVLAASSLSASSGCQSVEDTSPKTVRALRYQRLHSGSGLERSRAEGRWYEELYFPEQGVRANLVLVSEWDEDKNELQEAPQLNAFFGKIRNKFAVGPQAEEREQPTEEVRVPASLARQIFALAKAGNQASEDRGRLGEEAEQAGLLHIDVKPASFNQKK